MQMAEMFYSDNSRRIECRCFIRQFLFYTYTELNGKKGSDAVASIIHHFILNKLDSEIWDLHIFYDGCGGQNKNYTILRFFHYLVRMIKRLDNVYVTFVIRGYMQSDTDMALVNQITPAETPNQWNEAFTIARTKPFPL